MYVCIGLSIVLSLISMPLIIGFCKKFSLYDYQSARKIHSGNIPRLGGIGIVISFLKKNISMKRCTRVDRWIVKIRVEEEEALKNIEKLLSEEQYIKYI